MNELLHRMMGRVLMDAATGGDEGGGGGGGAPAASADAKGEGDTASDNNTSLLDDAGAAASAGGDDGKGAADDATLTPEQRAAKAAEKDTRRPKHIPGKFWNHEKGEANLEAWSKSYGELESRIRDVGLPPKDASEYKLEPPAAFKDSGVDFDPDTVAKLKGFAHKAGYSQKQFEATMQALYSEAESIVQTAERLDRAQTMKALTDHFKTPEVVQANVKAAYDVFSAYADEEEMKHIFRVVNDPVAIRVLAKIGKELKEDPGVNAADILTDDSIDELMARDSPYWDPKHPQHERVKAKVKAHYEAKGGGRKVA